MVICILLTRILQNTNLNNIDNIFELPILTQANLFNPRANYSQSKLAIILLTHYLQEKLQSENISGN
jgi:NAD(P)-dependent dehydrogenase (short-subunit alcohol dehydrogenase family)